MPLQYIMQIIYTEFKPKNSRKHTNYKAATFKYLYIFHTYFLLHISFIIFPMIANALNCKLFFLHISHTAALPFPTFFSSTFSFSEIQQKCITDVSIVSTIN